MDCIGNECGGNNNLTFINLAKVLLFLLSCLSVPNFTFIKLQTTTITTRPKPVYLWSVADVLKWFNRLCGDYNKYSQNFLNVSIDLLSNKSELCTLRY